MTICHLTKFRANSRHIKKYATRMPVDRVLVGCLRSGRTELVRIACLLSVCLLSVGSYAKAHCCGGPDLKYSFLMCVPNMDIRPSAAPPECFAC